MVPATHIWIEKALPGALMHDDAVKLKGQPAREMQIAAFHYALWGRRMKPARRCRPPPSR